MSYLEQSELESTYMMTTYARKNVEFVRGEGMRLFDSEGKVYLDFLSGVGAVCLGHANPAVSTAIALQAQRAIQVGNYYYSEGRGEYARDLSLLLNGGNAESAPWKSFFANSGAEANEGAIKLARKYGKLHLDGAGTILTAKRSFHGRTLATTAATGQVVKQESFTPLPSGFVHFAFNDLASFRDTLAECREAAQVQGRPELAPVAVLLECIQGEGGVWPLDEQVLQEIRAVTASEGILLILDEVQTGFFRTGEPFAYMHAHCRPDVVTLSKGIANGFPTAAVAATGVAADVFEPGEHGSTFGGNPLAIAAASATLSELLNRDIGAHVKETGAYFEAQLAALPHIVELRGKGLMLAVSLDEERATDVAEKVLEHGMIINSIGSDILRFLPPLIVGKADIDELISALSLCLQEL